MPSITQSRTPTPPSPLPKDAPRVARPSRLRVQGASRPVSHATPTRPPTRSFNPEDSQVCITKPRRTEASRTIRLSGILTLTLALSVYPVQPADSAPPEWHEGDGYRWSALQPFDPSHAPGFTKLDPARTGIQFTNRLSEEEIAGNRVLANGSGVAIGDYDGDGRPDLFFCGLATPNALYRNLGDWRFEEVTESAGLAFPDGYYRGAVFADLNGNGHLDLLVSTHDRGVMCFLNDGQGRFEDLTASANTAGSFAPTTLALADVNGDGSLDLYIVNYRPDDIRDRGEVNLTVRNNQVIIPPQFKDRLLYVEGQVLEYGQPDLLLLNDGRGRFQPVDWTGGLFLDAEGRPLESPPRDWGLAATFRDLNDDGLPDLYVCNDYWTPDRVWINQGNGVFKALNHQSLTRSSASSMGVDFADVNNDGILDFFVADMMSRDARLRKRQKPAGMPPDSFLAEAGHRPQFLRNTFFAGRGDGRFIELAWFAGLFASDWSWSPIFLDVDLDGLPDLLVSAGHFKDVQDMDANLAISKRQGARRTIADPAERQRVFTAEMLAHNRLYPPLDMPIVAFRNLGGFRFEEATDQWGTDARGIHHGIATADLDGDGDLDLIANNLNGAAGIFRNHGGGARIAVRLEGSPPNTAGIGARVILRGGARTIQTQEVISGGRYLAGCDPALTFATGNSGGPMTLEVRWPDGKTSRIVGLEPNRLYSVRETAALSTSASNPPDAPPPPAQPLFKRREDLPAWHHSDEPFDDFALQPLLPFKLSERGPGVAWHETSEDGTVELIVGAGRGGQPGRFQFRSGEFRRLSENTGISTPDDMTGLAVWKGPEPSHSLLFGLSRYENPKSEGLGTWPLPPDKAKMNVTPEWSTEGSGALALADVDGDGNLELAVVGHAEPRRYPHSYATRVYRWRDGGWREDSALRISLPPGTIPNGMVWSDLNHDGRPELVLACEWGPIRVFAYRQGRFIDTTADWGLDRWPGLWQGVTAGDFNGDGRMDLAASNWGLNSPLQADAGSPLTLAYGELFRPGVVDLVETEFLPGTMTLTPSRPLHELATALPFLQQHFSSFKQYSEAPLEAVLGERKVLARTATANTLESMVFLNLGTRFEGRPLPREAQWAPGFGVCVGDFNGDGREDLFVAQNFSAVRADWAPVNEGTGLLLLGDGSGGFKALSRAESGIDLQGDQRGAAVADFNGDGRLDLAVGVRGKEPAVYQNAEGSLGVRVQLTGSRGNADAIGTVIQAGSGDQWGPAREIHAGSGYWSQDGRIQVIHGPEGAPVERLRVRWPGGVVTEMAVSDAGTLTKIDQPGGR